MIDWDEWEIIFVNTSLKENINKLNERVYENLSSLNDTDYKNLIINIKNLLDEDINENYI